MYHMVCAVYITTNKYCSLNRCNNGKATFSINELVEDPALWAWFHQEFGGLTALPSELLLPQLIIAKFHIPFPLSV